MLVALLLAALAVPALTQTPTPSATHAPVLSASQIPNLDTVKREIVSYYDSGAWLREFGGVVASARSYVDAQLQTHPAKPAVVFDIDDTMLSDYGYEKSHDFGYDPHTYNEDVNAEVFPAIAPMLQWVHHLQAEGVALFYVTGRPTTQRAVTIGNLLRVGYPQPVALMQRPASYHDHSIIPFKSGARAQIEAEGYTILVSIGDQWSDQRGGHERRGFKLPNPMYYIP